MKLAFERNYVAIIFNTVWNIYHAQALIVIAAYYILPSGI
jgi:hypothetical protein